MKIGLFEEYLTGLFRDMPRFVCEGMIGMFALGTIVLFAIKGLKNRWRWCAGLLLVEYVTMIYCSTVVFRTSGSESGFDFTPFWSYGALLRGEDYILLPENVMNTVVFVPVGVLFSAAFRSVKWWQVLSLGCLISLSIETMQFVLKRGFTETDDVMHNTLGCLIGFGIYCLVGRGYKKLINSDLYWRTKTLR